MRRYAGAFDEVYRVALTIRYSLPGASEARRRFPDSASEIMLGAEDAAAGVDLGADSEASRPHARLSYSLSTWWIEDLGSGCGTRVNGARIEGLTPLRPGDLIQTGRTCMRLDFPSSADWGETGVIEHEFTPQETVPPPQISEDQNLEMLVRFSEIASHSRSSQAMLDSFLRELRATFPSAQRQTLVVIEDRELVARAFYPHDRAAFSFTLAREAIQGRRAFKWHNTDTTQISPSLEGVLCALYAPLLLGGDVFGVLHVDNAAKPAEFTARDLSLLVIVASTIAGALRGSKKSLVRYPSVFLSYAHADRAVADRLCAELRRRRVKVWFDERLRAGQPWLAQLESAIKKADALVLLVSPPAMASPNVAWELEIARRHQMRILPVLGSPCEMRPDLRYLQYITLDKFEEGATALADQLHESTRRRVIR